jgi:hypothetical protein
MSRLSLHSRPFVVFEPANKDHRKWFAEFNRSSKWGDCPVRFVVEDDNGDLVTMIQRRLIQYYVSREFSPVTAKTVVKKPQKIVVKKPQNNR